MADDAVAEEEVNDGETTLAEPTEGEPQVTNSVEQQQTFEGAFPQIDEELEVLIAQHEEAKAIVKRAADRKTSAYDVLKEAMRARGLASYKCYRSRFAAEMNGGDPKVKTRAVKEDEPSPYTPANAAPAA